MVRDDHSPPVETLPDTGAAFAEVEVGERDGQGQGRRAFLRGYEWAVSAGAILGVWARFTISDYGSHHFSAAFPVATLAINLLGCLLIGCVQSLFLDLLAIQRTLQLFLAVGLLGGFTTFSTFSVELVQLLEGGQVGRAGAYLALSLVGGPLAAAVGIVLTHRAYRALGLQRGVAR